MSSLGNAMDDCYPAKDTKVQSRGFENYTHLAWYFFAAVFGIASIMAMLSALYDKFKNRHLGREAMQSLKLNNSDSNYALDAIGDDSVYRFFLSKSCIGWPIALVTLASQLWMTFLFVEGSEVDLSADTSDLAYTWKVSIYIHEQFML